MSFSQPPDTLKVKPNNISSEFVTVRGKVRPNHMAKDGLELKGYVVDVDRVEIEEYKSKRIRGKLQVIKGVESLPKIKVIWLW